MILFDTNFTLTHGSVFLTLLKPEHLEALKAAANDPRIWTLQPQIQRNFQLEWFDRAMKQLNQQKRYPFAIQYQGQWIGSSSFYDIDEQHKRMNIGYTWYAPHCWGTALNATVKLLMLQYAFETLNMKRVAFTVDTLNIRVCKALANMGITKEGVLRNHMVRSDGSSRDTVVFAIIDTEWPAIKKRLLSRIQENA